MPPDGLVSARPSGEPEIGKDSFSIPWKLLVGENKSAAVALVYGTDAALSSPATNTLGAALAKGDYTASLTGLAPDTAYWWKLVVIAGVTNKVDGSPCPPTGSVSRFLNGAFDGDVSRLPAGTVSGTAAQFFKDAAHGDYRPKTGGPLVGAGANYEGMAEVDLSGVQKRLLGRDIDVGAYEGPEGMTILILQ